MFKPQKALHLHLEEAKKKPKYVEQAYAIFEKYDGWYGYYDPADKQIKSRAHRVIPAVEHLAPLFHHVTGSVPIFEILLRDVTEFSVLNGILNRKAKAETAYLKVHDYYDYCSPSDTLSKRQAQVHMLVEGINDTRVEIAPILGVSRTPEVWRAKAREVWEMGGEGIILKRVQAPISLDKRNADLMKIKLEVTLDLYVTDIIRGEGKYAGTVGALVCRDKAFNVHKISGMSDSQRHEWWSNRSAILGRVVEVQAMCILPNGSLREPRFKAVRYDKTAVDID